jgi:Putative prokaryotic signal transducing protein
MSEPVRVTVVQDEPEAEIVCSLLRSEGIECYHRPTNVTAGAFDGVIGSGGSREVLVAPGELERARELLAAATDEGDEARPHVT